MTKRGYTGRSQEHSLNARGVSTKQNFKKNSNSITSQFYLVEEGHPGLIVSSKTITAKSKTDLEKQIREWRKDVGVSGKTNIHVESDNWPNWEETLIKQEDAEGEYISEGKPKLIRTLNGKKYKYHASYYNNEWAKFRREELENDGWIVKQELTDDGVIRLYKRAPEGLR